MMQVNKTYLNELDGDGRFSDTSTPDNNQLVSAGNTVTHLLADLRSSQRNSNLSFLSGFDETSSFKSIFVFFFFFNCKLLGFLLSSFKQRQIISNLRNRVDEELYASNTFNYFNKIYFIILLRKYQIYLEINQVVNK